VGTLEIIAVISLALAGMSALVILFDIFIAGHRQKMWIMEVVWPVTALYFGPFAVWAYWVMGRTLANAKMSSSDHTKMKHKKKPFWHSVTVAVTHCGGGCTLGDIIAEWSIFWLGVTIAGIALWPELIGDYILAYTLGIVFQYLTIAPMRNLSFGQGIIAAIKADTLSLTAFEIGLFGWMMLMRFVLFDPPLHPDEPAYWFMMQIGMILGFFTAYPMNWWLVRKGLKEAM
jgi:hypothetical protein